LSKKASDDIAFSQFLFEEDFVNVTFLKSLAASNVGDAQLGPFEEGREAKVPLWAARVLEGEGIAKLTDAEQALKSSDLYKLSWKEERNEVVSMMPSHFYPKLRVLLLSLNEGIKENPTHTLLSEQRQSLMKAQDLVNCRLQKILRLAMERNPTKSLIEVLEPEEKALYSALRSEIEGWRKKILIQETK